ncbi:MAG: hypothetical protein NT013_16000 [Planctomycetia bacterium]|nr:hypothetical protein [Planctomycetia bacterium]
MLTCETSVIQGCERQTVLNEIGAGSLSHKHPGFSGYLVKVKSAEFLPSLTVNTSSFVGDEYLTGKGGAWVLIVTFAPAKGSAAPEAALLGGEITTWYVNAGTLGLLLHCSVYSPVAFTVPVAM